MSGYCNKANVANIIFQSNFKATMSIIKFGATAPGFHCDEFIEKTHHDTLTRGFN